MGDNVENEQLGEGGIFGDDSGGQHDLYEVEIVLVDQHDCSLPY